MVNAKLVTLGTTTLLETATKTANNGKRFRVDSFTADRQMRLPLS